MQLWLAEVLSTMNTIEHPYKKTKQLGLNVGTIFFVENRSTNPCQHMWLKLLIIYKISNDHFIVVVVAVVIAVVKHIQYQTLPHHTSMKTFPPPHTRIHVWVPDS